MARAHILLLVFVGSIFVAISLAGAYLTESIDETDPTEGGCGNAYNCPNEQSCTSGAAKENCYWSSNGGCKKIDFLTNDHNYGSCNTLCTFLNDICCSGKCTLLLNHPENCGTCGQLCPLENECCSGECRVRCIPNIDTPLP